MIVTMSKHKNSFDMPHPSILRWKTEKCLSELGKLHDFLYQYMSVCVFNPFWISGQYSSKSKAVCVHNLFFFLVWEEMQKEQTKCSGNFGHRTTKTELLFW